MKRKTLTPKITTDTDGQLIALVPLANHDKPAKLLLADYDELLGYGVTLFWTYNTNGASRRRYVRCHDRARGNMEMVARLILRPGKNRVIRYRDNDALNLRKENLLISGGKAHGKPKAIKGRVSANV